MAYEMREGMMTAISPLRDRTPVPQRGKKLQACPTIGGATDTALLDLAVEFIARSMVNANGAAAFDIANDCLSRSSNAGHAAHAELWHRVGATVGTLLEPSTRAEDETVH